MSDNGCKTDFALTDNFFVAGFAHFYIMPGMSTLSDYFKTPGAPKKKDFATRIGTTQVHLSRIIHGDRRPSFDLMVKISAATKGVVDLDDWRAKE